MKRIISSICLIGILMMTLSSCVYMHHGAPKFRREWSKLKDQAMDVVMYAMYDEDGYKDKVYKILKNAFSKEDFDAEYERIHSMLKGAEGMLYISVVSFTSEKEDGVTLQNGTFGLYTDAGNFIIEASLRSDTDGLTSFSIVPDAENVLPEREE